MAAAPAVQRTAISSEICRSAVSASVASRTHVARGGDHVAPGEALERRVVGVACDQLPGPPAAGSGEEAAQGPGDRPRGDEPAGGAGRVRVSGVHDRDPAARTNDGEQGGPGALPVWDHGERECAERSVEPLAGSQRAECLESRRRQPCRVALIEPRVAPAVAGATRTSTSEHRGREVDSHQRSRWPDALFDQREVDSGPARQVEHPVAGTQIQQLDRPRACLRVQKRLEVGPVVDRREPPVALAHGRVRRFPGAHLA